MNETVFLKRPDADVGDRHDYRVDLKLESFDLYGRHHEVSSGVAGIAVTRLSDGLHLGIELDITVETTCDRTLEDVSISLEIAEDEFLEAPDDDEISVTEWTFDPKRYAERAIPSEIPMQVFSRGSEPVNEESEEDVIDSRWKGLDDLFASGL